MNARSSRARPQYLEVNGRRLFALHVEPLVALRGQVLYLPPFAEEMNRCRSHVALQARALAAAGWGCVLLDPYGTGESEGEISEIDWQVWLDDAAEVARGMRERHEGPLVLWGLRTGALLAAELLSTGLVSADRLLFWQPVLDGGLFVTQHLRLRIASQLVHDAERETSEDIRRRLAEGEAIEIAGYPLPGRMASALGSRRLAAMARLEQSRIDWIEIVGKPEQPLAAPSRKVVDAVRQAGGQVVATTVNCPPIWQLYEREKAPQLVEATSRVFLGEVA